MSFEHASLVSRVKAASLVDAMGRALNHRAHILDLATPTPGRVLFGPAVTMSFVPMRQDLMDAERHNFARLFYEAVRDDPVGKALVMKRFRARARGRVGRIQKPWSNFTVIVREREETA